MAPASLVSAASKSIGGSAAGEGACMRKPSLDTLQSLPATFSCGRRKCSAQYMNVSAITFCWHDYEL